ncbi:MAG: ABC transporter permease subunit [Actinobacteria bacterium]|nr:ABC transporter permease subunit [Actinomycetota bacterium]
MSSSVARISNARRFKPWPYLLIAPSLIALGLILGFPVYKLISLSFERYGLAEIIAGEGVFVGLENFKETFTDPEFWNILKRTLFFTLGMVSVSIVVGAWLAHLMVKMHPGIRYVLNTVLILVWAMPQLVSISVWRWIFSFDFSIVTAVINSMGFEMDNHNYFVNTFSGFLIIGGCVAWGALPFITISIYAALTQVPKDLIEAAEIDGANPRQVFRNIIFPMLLPIYIILISLSIIWDFQVFSHIWIFLDSRPSAEYYTMAIYAFQKSFGLSEYGMGAAISLIMIFALVGVTGYYLRQMMRMGDE